MILAISLTILGILLAGYIALVMVFFIDGRKDRKKSKTTHQPEKYWKQQIGWY
jgi:flagellar basal body-associated protein FliL